MSHLAATGSACATPSCLSSLPPASPAPVSAPHAPLPPPTTPAPCSLLSEAYLPYINDLSAEHLARQISTFGCYLDLLGHGMEWQAVYRQLMAFMRVGGWA